MADDALDQVLRLVAEGRLTATEAGPLLDALDARRTGPSAAGREGAAGVPVDDRPASALRVEVSEAGRSVVNLRVPLALGRAAIARVPGLSDATSDRIREAIEAGIKGPILEVDDGDDVVRVTIE
jgi:hypothetical protein